MIDACDGSVSGAVATACEKRMPSSASAVERGRGGGGIAVAAQPIGADGVEGDEEDVGRCRGGDVGLSGTPGSAEEESGERQAEGGAVARPLPSRRARAPPPAFPRRNRHAQVLPLSRRVGTLPPLEKTVETKRWNSTLRASEVGSRRFAYTL